MTDALELLAALCMTEFVHNVFEIWGMNQKVKWLDLMMRGRPHGRWPLSIDSRTKTFVLHTAIILLFSSVSLLVLKVINLSEPKLIWLGVMILLINYLYTTWKVDQFHTSIGKLIARIKK